MTATKKQNFQVGFTLAEVIIAIFSAMLIVGAFITLFLLHSSLYSQQQATVRVSESMRQAMQAMQLHVNQAYRVMGGHDFSGTYYLSDADTLVLQLPSIDSQINVIAGTWDYVAFDLYEGKLFLKVEPDPSSSRIRLEKKLADSVTSFSLAYSNADFALVRQVTADLQIQIDIKGGSVTSAISQNLNLINY